MARWSRAAHLLDLPSGSRVLDLGCAFGFGTRMLVGRYEAYGHDLNEQYISRARKSVPSATFTLGPADKIPYPDNFFDGVVFLDVLEHVPDEASVVQEIARVLRPAGELIMSVPNDGLLASWDSLNVYRRRFRGAPPPTDDPSWTLSPRHRHYTVDTLMDMLRPDFEVEKIQYTGVGLAEPVNLLLLAVFRAWINAPRVYNVLQYLYFGVYLAEDMLPAGKWGYHLMLKARRH